jgi:hypothetical protein
VGLNPRPWDDAANILPLCCQQIGLDLKDLDFFQYFENKFDRRNKELWFKNIFSFFVTDAAAK